MRLGYLGAHQAHREQPAEQGGIEGARLVHLTDERTDLALREVRHGLPEELLVLAQGG